jgi:RNA polymerase sigma-70 factor, ECF subfamily
MASEPTRYPAKDHLLTPKNSALMIVDYQPVQTVHPSLNSIAQIHAKDVMNICSSQEEISVKLLRAAAATDEMLVEAARLGNRPAFAELWERHSNRAFKVANRISKNHDDAEDIIQEAWMKSYVHLNTFDGRAKFSTWLTRIVINSALMTLRRKRAHPETSMEITDGEIWQPREIADQTKNAEEIYARIEGTERLRRAICRLPPSLRNVVEIHQSNDSSIKEIAKIAGLSVAATKSRLLRARAALRSDLVERPEKQWRSSQKGIDECSIRLGRPQRTRRRAKF